jgi:hypothetical protein
MTSTVRRRNSGVRARIEMEVMLAHRLNGGGGAPSSTLTSAGSTDRSSGASSVPSVC